MLDNTLNFLDLLVSYADHGGGSPLGSAVNCGENIRRAPSATHAQAQHRAHAVCTERAVATPRVGPIFV